MTGAPNRGLPETGGQRGGIERRQLLQGLGRIGFAGEVLHMRRQVAQLTGSVDQAGLFRTLLAVTNKLHSRFSLEIGPVG
ncbi:hypothetical protein ACVMBZ_002867 [Bradyrhizobium liaoningense]